MPVTPVETTRFGSRNSGTLAAMMTDPMKMSA